MSHRQTVHRSIAYLGLFSALAAVCTGLQCPGGAGSLNPPATGGNTPPRIVITTVTTAKGNNFAEQGDPVTINFTGADAEDASTVRIFASLSGNPTDASQELPILDGFGVGPGSGSGTAIWQTAGVSPGTYNIFGEIDDHTFNPLDGSGNRPVRVAAVSPVVIAPLGTTPANTPPEVQVFLPNTDAGLSNQDVLTVRLQVRDKNSDTNTLTISYLLDKDLDPTNDGVQPTIRLQDLDDTIGAGTIPPNVFDPISKNFTIDLTKIPLRRDTDEFGRPLPYFVRVHVSDGKGGEVDGYAPGSLRLLSAATGVVDTLGVGGRVAGATFQGFGGDPADQRHGDHAGSSFASLGDLDNDGLADFAILAESATPFNVQTSASGTRAGVGEAFVVYGRPRTVDPNNANAAFSQGRYSGILSLNTVGTFIDFPQSDPRYKKFFSIRGHAVPNTHESRSNFMSLGVTSLTAIPDLTGDQRPEFFTGTPFNVNVEDVKDLDPCDTCTFATDKVAPLTVWGPPIFLTGNTALTGSLNFGTIANGAWKPTDPTSSVIPGPNVELSLNNQRIIDITQIMLTMSGSRVDQASTPFNLTIQLEGPCGPQVTTSIKPDQNANGQFTNAIIFLPPDGFSPTRPVAQGTQDPLPQGDSGADWFPPSIFDGEFTIFAQPTSSGTGGIQLNSVQLAVSCTVSQSTSRAIRFVYNDGMPTPVSSTPGCSSVIPTPVQPFRANDLVSSKIQVSTNPGYTDVTSFVGASSNELSQWHGPLPAPTWSQFPGNIRNPVYAMINSYNNGMTVAGDFTTTAGITTNRVAFWDGVTSTWSKLGLGMDAAVYALTVFNGDLIAGGSFTTAGGVTVNQIARWDGASWHAMGSGTDGPVSALTVFNNTLIAGGNFSSAGGVGANNIAVWNGASWAALGAGVNGPVNALTVFNNNLIAGGIFTTAGGIGASNIAQWNGAAWQALGLGTDGWIGALNVFNGELIAAGQFVKAGGVARNNIARWNGATWNSLANGIGGTNAFVKGLTIFNTQLIVTGNFSTPFTYIARWDGTNWLGLGSFPQDALRTPGRAATVFNNVLVVGGATFPFKSDIFGGPVSPPFNRGRQSLTSTFLGAGFTGLLATTGIYNEMLDGRIDTDVTSLVTASPFRTDDPDAQDNSGDLGAYESGIVYMSASDQLITPLDASGQWTGVGCPVQPLGEFGQLYGGCLNDALRGARFRGAWYNPEGVAGGLGPNASPYDPGSLFGTTVDTIPNARNIFAPNELMISAPGGCSTNAALLDLTSNLAGQYFMDTTTIPTPPNAEVGWTSKEVSFNLGTHFERVLAAYLTVNGTSVNLARLRASLTESNGVPVSPAIGADTTILLWTGAADPTQAIPDGRLFYSQFFGTPTLPGLLDPPGTPVLCNDLQFDFHDILMQFPIEPAQDFFSGAGFNFGTNDVAPLFASGVGKIKLELLPDTTIKNSSAVVTSVLLTVVGIQAGTGNVMVLEGQDYSRADDIYTLCNSANIFTNGDKEGGNARPMSWPSSGCDGTGNIPVRQFCFPQMHFFVKGANQDDAFGWAHYAGDINRDGVPDLICGAPLSGGYSGANPSFQPDLINCPPLETDPGGALTRNGKVYLLYGQLAMGSGLPCQYERFEIRGSHNNDEFGRVQGGAGALNVGGAREILDMDGDGRDDIFFAAEKYDAAGSIGGVSNRGTDAGFVGILFGKAVSQGQTGQIAINAEQVGTPSYPGVKFIGGSANARLGGSESAKVCPLFYPNPITFDSNGLRSDAPAPPDRLADLAPIIDRGQTGVANAGDFNQDGLSDLLMTAPGQKWPGATIQFVNTVTDGTLLTITGNVNKTFEFDFNNQVASGNIPVRPVSNSPADCQTALEGALESSLSDDLNVASLTSRLSFPAGSPNNFPTVTFLAQTPFKVGNVNNFNVTSSSGSITVHIFNRRGVSYLVFGSANLLLNKTFYLPEDMNRKVNGARILKGIVFVSAYEENTTNDITKPSTAPIDAVMGIGDVDGDGQPDIILGAPRADFINILSPNQVRKSVGESYLIYGNSFGPNSSATP